VSHPAGPSSARSAIETSPRSSHAAVGNAWAFATGVLVVIGLVFRWMKLGSLSLWFDEGYTAWITSNSWLAILHYIRADTAPPLYYITLQSWTQIFGNSEWGLRSLSAAASTTTIFVVWATADRCLRSGFARFIAVSLVALSSMQIEFAQEARSYALLALFEAVTIYFIVRRVEGGGFGFVLAATACQVAAVYTQNIMLFYGVAIFAAWCVWPVPGNPTTRLRPAARRRLWHRRGLETRLCVRDAAIAGSIVLLLYIPWVPTLIQQARAVGSSFWVAPPARRDVSDLATAMFGTQAYWELIVLIDKYRVGSRELMHWCSLLAGGGLMAHALFARKRQAAALMVCAWLPIYFGIIYSCWKTSIFLPKAFIASIPPIALLLALPADAMLDGSPQAGGQRPVQRLRRRLVRSLSFTAIVVLFLLLVPTLIGYVMDHKKENWRSAGQFVAALPPQVRLIEFDANDGQPTFDYYYNRYRNTSEPRPAESGVPNGFFDNRPPRAMQRVLSLSDLAGLRRQLTSGKFAEIDLVLSHRDWADPETLSLIYMKTHARLIPMPDGQTHWESPDNQVAVWRFRVPLTAATRSTTRPTTTRSTPLR